MTAASAAAAAAVVGCFLVGAGAAWGGGEGAGRDAAGRTAPVAAGADLLSGLHRLAVVMQAAMVLEGDASRAEELSPDTPTPAGTEIAPEGGGGGGLPELEALARRFDYSVEAVRGLSRVYVLKKRYSRPDDLPEVTFEECAASLGDVHNLMAPFDPGMPALPTLTPRVQELLASFTPEQLAVMRRQVAPSGMVASSPAPDAALPVSALTKEQREVVTGMAVANYAADAFRVAGESAKEAEWLVKNGVNLRWGDLNGGLFLGYESPLAPQRPGVRPLGPLPLPGNRDQAAPAATVPPAAAQTPSHAVRVLSLRDLARTGSGAAAGGTGTSPTQWLAVDPALGGKRITVVSGATGADGKRPTDGELASAAASLFGLRLVALSDGGLRLSRRRTTPASDIAGLQASIRDALPAPVARALLGPSAPPEEGRRGGPRSGVTPDVKPGAPPGVTPVAARMEKVRGEALRDLRRETGGKLHHTRIAPLPLSECGEGAGRAFAVAYLLNSLQGMEKVVAHPVPPTISRISELCISGGIVEKNGLSVFGMVFSVPQGEGKRLRTGSIVLVRHPLPPSLRRIMERNIERDRERTNARP